MALKKVITLMVGGVVALSFGLVSAASALTVSCVGTPTASNVTWTGSSLNGVAPVAFLWGNGATSSSQVVSVVPGTYTMTLQGTDASSTVATTTCSATVVQAVPSISTFVAAPTTITAGQSSVLSWTASNASSTSIDSGVGIVTGTSVTVTPSVTTTYHLFAVNPAGTSTASVVVTVNPVSNTGGGITSQIQALLQQIAALKAQILALLQQQGNGTGSTGTTTPPVIGTCFKGDHDLKRGDRGNDVSELQRILAKDPSILPQGLATGFFGEKTEKALIKFQRKFGLASSSTGFFGTRTRGLMRRHCDDERGEHSSMMATSSTSTLQGDWGKKHENENENESGESHGGRGRGSDRNN